MHYNRKEQVIKPSKIKQLLPLYSIQKLKASPLAALNQTSENIEFPVFFEVFCFSKIEKGAEKGQT